jgi:hypothetical protein
VLLCFLWFTGKERGGQRKNWKGKRKKEEKKRKKLNV